MTDKKLKIVFFGTPEFAVKSLDSLLTAGFDIAAVVTATDKPAGRGHKMLQSAVKEYAVANDLNILQPVSLKDPEFVDKLKAINADLFIVIAFRMLPEVVWTMPRLGTFNLHGSLLPRYRGAAPINWAIINGDKETGVTTFFLKHEIDTGDIIDQKKIAVGDNENFGSVYERLMNIGAELTVNTVQRIIDGTLTTTPQDSAGLDSPTPAPKIFKDTC
ncbi:MAG: methionyl-tRNA formyltransferase, partial [Muribaculaceae bacterium]|nr:methionyl-tRNA formyltransferase [Muribaculaceae bacterium]